jgi:hypothetical protein
MTPERPIDMRVVKDAIHDWVSNALRTDSATVIWSDQDAPQPEYPFVTLKVISGPDPLSPHWGVVEETDTRRLHEEIERLSYIQCRMTVSCQAFTSRKLAMENEADAVALLNSARACLAKQSVRDTFELTNISVASCEAASDISDLEETTFVSRASMEVVFGIVLTVRDYVTYIESVELKVRVTGRG